VQQAVGFFGQDTLRLNAKLTFELGLRYDVNLAPADSEDRFVVYDAATNSLVQVGGAGGPDQVYRNSPNLQPRFGAIFSPTPSGRTVVRAAYGLMVDQPVTNAVIPLTTNPPLAAPLSFSGNIQLANAAATALAGGIAPNSITPDFEGGRVQTWNVNVEQQVGPALGVMIGYFGSEGDRLRIARNINQFVNGVRPHPTLSPASPILPGSALGNVTEVTSLGASHYNGLWITANQRPLRGLQFNASYTLSKSTDYNSLSSSVVTAQNSFDLAESEGPSDFDARHRFVINVIYDLPFKGNAFVEGWQLGAITQAQSGNPISIVTNITTFTGVNNSLRPDLVGDPAIIGQPTQWFANSVCDPRIAACAPRTRCSRCRYPPTARSTSAASDGTPFTGRALATPTSRSSGIFRWRAPRVCSCASRCSTSSTRPTSASRTASRWSAGRRSASSRTRGFRPAIPGRLGRCSWRRSFSSKGILHIRRVRLQADFGCG
jgi:hypothetical protein